MNLLLTKESFFYKGVIQVGLDCNEDVAYFTETCNGLLDLTRKLVVCVVMNGVKLNTDHVDV